MVGLAGMDPYEYLYERDRWVRAVQLAIATRSYELRTKRLARAIRNEIGSLLFG